MTRLLPALLALSILALHACNDEEALPPPPPPTSPDSALTTIAYLALGDSYTIGESVPRVASFPYQLADSLRARKVAVSEVTVIAETGWRADVLLDAIDERSTGPTPDLVTVLIGVNDQYQGRDVGGFRQNFTRVLDRAEELAAGGREDVVVVTIPDYSVTPFVAGRDTAAIRRELDVFNAAVREEAAARGLPVVDVTPGSRAARDNPGGLLAEDGLHPSGRQYAQWVREMLPAVMEVVVP